MPRRRSTLYCLALLAVLPGCYREVVSAKGLGAPAFDREIRAGSNYSGLPFDESTQRETRRIVVPGTGSPRRAN